MHIISAKLLLHLAAKHNYNNGVEIILNADADVDQVEPRTGRTALHRACEFGSQQAILQLLRKKASVDVQDHGNKSALFVAVCGPSVQVLPSRMIESDD